MLGEEAKVGAPLASVLPGIANIDTERCIRDGLIINHEESVGQRYLQFIIRGLPDLGIAHVYGSDITEHKNLTERIRVQNQRASRAVRAGRHRGAHP